MIKEQWLQYASTAGWVAGLLVATLVLFSIKRFILVRIRKNQTSTEHLSSVLTHALDRPISLLILLTNVFFIVHILEYLEWLDQSAISVLNNTVKIGLIVILLVFFERLVDGTIRHLAVNSEAIRNSSTIARGTARVLVLALGLLIILSTLGISITPVIASLGITSLAVALALQPTLENFFSGIQLIADKPFKVGDFIELESGEQGFVDKIGWRSTWIKMLPNNFVILPNSQLSQSKIINYFYPEKELSVPVEVGVHYDSDLDFVEKITLEVAKYVLKEHEWGVTEYDTFVIYHTFDSSSINFTVMLRAKEYFNQFFIRSMFIKELHKRFKQEGIVIPYPIRAINTDQENAKLRQTDD